eukprot:769417-Lingulodinium_polyedra.AAC.1
MWMRSSASISSFFSTATAAFWSNFVVRYGQLASVHRKLKHSLAMRCGGITMPAGSRWKSLVGAMTTT